MTQKNVDLLPYVLREGVDLRRADGPAAADHRRERPGSLPNVDQHGAKIGPFVRGPVRHREGGAAAGGKRDARSRHLGDRELAGGDRAQLDFVYDERGVADVDNPDLASAGGAPGLHRAQVEIARRDQDAGIADAVDAGSGITVSRSEAFNTGRLHRAVRARRRAVDRIEALHASRSRGAARPLGGAIVVHEANMAGTCVNVADGLRSRAVGVRGALDAGPVFIAEGPVVRTVGAEPALGAGQGRRAVGPGGRTVRMSGALATDTVDTEGPPDGAVGVPLAFGRALTSAEGAVRKAGLGTGATVTARTGDGLAWQTR